MFGYFLAPRELYKQGGFDTIKNAKKEGKQLVLNKYKNLFVPAIIYMILFAIEYLFINVIISYMYWERFNPLCQIILLLIFVSIEFAFIPLSSVALFKTITCLEGKSEVIERIDVKKMFSSNSISKAIKINFLPMLLRMLVQTCSAKMFYYNKNYMWVAIVASWIDIFVSYKFFACNYFIAIGNDHPIKNSFNLMKKCFWKYILLIFSFIGYEILAGCIGILLQYLITGGIAKNLYMPQLKVFNSFGYGVGFFLIPYSFSSYYFWIKQKTQTENKTKKLHNQ